jgi:hypothetical protein
MLLPLQITPTLEPAVLDRGRLLSSSTTEISPSANLPSDLPSCHRGGRQMTSNWALGYIRAATKIRKRARERQSILSLYILGCFTSHDQALPTLASHR